MTREWRILILGLAPMLLISWMISFNIYQKVQRDKKIESIKVVRHEYTFPNKKIISVEVEKCEDNNHMEGVSS